MAQVFVANKMRVFKNGAIGYAPGGWGDCLGPYAKVKNCPIVVNGTFIGRLTCYATGYADTVFSVPACTRKNGRHVKGYFAHDNDGGVEFRVLNDYCHLFKQREI